jgi:hypothetical protein
MAALTRRVEVAVRPARRSGPPGRGGDLEEMVVATTTRVHVVKFLPWEQDERLLLFIGLGRSRTNIALAARQAGAAAAVILA